jgi:polyhydroxybutyrate depolymerase
MNRFAQILLMILVCFTTSCSAPEPASDNRDGEVQSESSEPQISDEDSAEDVEAGDAEPDEATADEETVTPTEEENDDSSSQEPDDVPSSDPRRSAGCERVDYSQSEAERFLEVEGVSRRYQVKLPRNYSSGTAYPMLFALHGLNETGDTPRGQFSDVIDDDAFQVFPDGEGEQWNNTTDMVFIDALLTSLQDEYCLDPARVFAAGFSAGGGGTHAIGCYLGDRFRAIAPIAGTGTFTECEGRVAVMQIQGTSDFVAREEAAAAVREHWIAVNQCEGVESAAASDFNRCDAFAGCMEDYPTLYCEHNGGHEWPSWANPIIWDFFKSLDPIVPGDDPEEGNDGVQASSVKFTIEIPEDFEGVPLKLAPILYGPNTFQPIFVAPSLILNNGAPIGEEFVLGEQVEYEISPINLAGLDLPANFTFTVVVYVEGGGDPTPCGKDWIGLTQARIEGTGDLIIDEPMRLEPFLAIPFFFDCPEE